MPPQQTDLTSETERDAAPLSLGPSITLMKDAMDGASAAVRLDVPALSDALSEKDAAGLTAGSTRSVLSLLKQYWRAFQAWSVRRASRISLHDLSKRELMDIAPGEIEYIAAQRAIDRLRDGTAYLWIRSRGVP